ncbi:hypothetical protein TYRP_008523, partial [Tyrophagus putrescentiae]
MGRKSDRNTWAFAHSLSSNATNQLNVFGLESDAFGVGGTQIGVLQTVDQRTLTLMSWAISITRRLKESLGRSSLQDFWYWRMSRRATIPGRYRRGFFTLP